MMKKILLFLIGLFSLTPLWADDFSRAQQILDWIKAGQGDSLVTNFHPNIRGRLPGKLLRRIWHQMEKQTGPFVTQGEWLHSMRDSLNFDQCKLDFTEEQVRFALLTDQSGRIIGFHFNPVSGEVLPDSCIPQRGRDYVERDTFIREGRIKLPGTLCFPTQGKHFPMVVMLHGLGACDRDGTIGPNKPYLEVARYLASQGIGSLRYDKRSYVYGSRPHKFGVPSTYDTEVVDDALMALRFLSTLPETDVEKIVVIGHSLGGTLAPRVAMLSSIPVAGLISVAGSTRTMEDWLRAQFRHLAEIEGTSFAQADSLTQMIYSKMPSSYCAFAAEYNPIGTARGLQIPMLFIHGGHDFQVTRYDYERWKTGLVGRQNAEFLWLENADHLMREIPKMAVPGVYTLPGNVSLKGISAMANFIHALR